MKTFHYAQPFLIISIVMLISYNIGQLNNGNFLISITGVFCTIFLPLIVFYIGHCHQKLSSASEKETILLNSKITYNSYIVMLGLAGLVGTATGLTGLTEKGQISIAVAALFITFLAAYFRSRHFVWKSRIVTKAIEL